MKSPKLLPLLPSILALCLLPTAFTFAQKTPEGEKSPDLLAEFMAAERRPKMAWAGVWAVGSRFAPRELRIKMRGKDRFDFELNAASGANIGEIAGTAAVRGRLAYFDDRQPAADGRIAKKDEGSGCRLLFSHRKNFIEVRETPECAYYRGNAVFFTGEYRRGKPAVPEKDFVGLGVLPETETDRRFRALVGNDYESFLDVFQLVSRSEDLDGLGASVFTGCVRGVCPLMTGIIMFAEKGRFYAMVLDIDETDRSVARYYSNDRRFLDKLPKTIERWLAEKRPFAEDLRVLYKNATK